MSRGMLSKISRLALKSPVLDSHGAYALVKANAAIQLTTSENRRVVSTYGLRSSNSLWLIHTASALATSGKCDAITSGNGSGLLAVSPARPSAPSVSPNLVGEGGTHV